MHRTAAALGAGDPRRMRLRIVTPRMVERALASRGLEGVLSPPERLVFESLAIERRRRDWLAGRLAAKLAVRATLRARGDGAVPANAISVLNDSDGAPFVRIDGGAALSSLGYNISIAHDDGFALCALARTADRGLVGVDLERDRPLDPRFIRYVLTEREGRRLAADQRFAPPLLAIWTLKEAVIKAARDVRRDARVLFMREVELAWRGHRRVRARLVGGSAPAVRITARWRRQGEYLLASATCRPASAN